MIWEDHPSELESRMMVEYKVFTPNVMVDSSRIVGFISGFPPGMRETGIHILEKHGIIDVRPGGWHPVQPWLDAMREISERFDSNTLFQIIKRTALQADIPEDLKSLRSCLSNMNTLYRSSHQGENIGGWDYKYEKNGHWKKITLISTSVYPCSLDLGMITGFVELVKPDECLELVVAHEKNGPCRSQGNNFCVYTVVWSELPGIYEESTTSRSQSR
jgi:hypothetical protein